MFPEVFRIGGFTLHTYGLLVAIAFLSALSLTGRLARRAGLKQDSVLNLGLYCVLAGILGAKLLMVLLDLPYYLSRPGEIFSFSSLQAGGVFYGGLIAALGTAALYIRKAGLPLLKTADVFAPGLAMGHAIGRLGCFSAGCCWGKPTSLPWGVTFTNPLAAELSGTPLGVRIHPTQLYESLAEAVIFAVLYRRIQKPHGDGTIIGMYLVLYSIARFVVEFWRVHDQANPFGGPLNASQWIALALAGLGIYWLRKSELRTAA